MFGRLVAWFVLFAAFNSNLSQSYHFQVFELITGEVLFKTNTDATTGMTTADQLLAKMVVVTKEQFQYDTLSDRIRSRYFNSDGEHLTAASLISGTHRSIHP